MSETLPRSNPRLENFEANKAAYEAKQAADEKAQFEDAVFGEAGVTDFSDEGKRRVEEADAYEQHLASMTNRDANYDPIDNPETHQAYQQEVEAAYAENEARDAATAAHEQAITDMIAADPKLRRMEMMAHDIAELSATKVTPENADRAPGVLADKQEKLLELLGKFDADETLRRDQRTDIIDRIAAISESTPAAAETAPEEDEDSSEDSESEDGQGAVEERESDASDDKKPTEDKEVAQERPLGVAPEPIVDEADEKEALAHQNPAEEGESLEEYEARNGFVEKAPGKELELYKEPNEHGNEYIAAGFEEGAVKQFAEDEMSRFEQYQRKGNNAMVNLWGAGNRFAEKTREKLSGKKRLAWVLGGVALAGAVAAAWINRDGIQDFFSGNNMPHGDLGLGDQIDKIPADSGTGTGSTGAGDLIGGSFTVESGHGYTQELVDFAKANGHDLSPQESFNLHNHLVDAFGADYIQGVGHYTDGNELHLSGTGKAHFADGVAADIKKTLNW